jgi:hypothetical protein
MRLATAALALLAIAAAPPARARVEVGTVLGSQGMPTLDGRTEPLTAKVAVNVVVFWRPDQEHSLDTLKQMASCEKEFAGKPVHMVAVVSGSYAAADVRAAVDGAAMRMPVLVDANDELYGRLEVRQHPVVLVADAAGKVTLWQPYVRLRYCEIVNAHVRFLLKEIDAAQLERVLNPPRASFPDDDKRNIARRYVKMGKLEAEDGHCDRAVVSFGKALEIAPDDKDAAAGLAACAAGGAPTAKK